MRFRLTLSLAFLVAAAALLVLRNYSAGIALASQASAGAKQSSVQPLQEKTDASPPASGADGSNEFAGSMAALEHGTLTVWVSKTSVLGMPPREMDHHWDERFLPKFKKDFPNFDLHFVPMEREEFEKAMHAPPDASFPDVAFVENLREYAPLRESDSVIAMWGMPRFTLGWWVIFRQTSNMAAARAFLLWLEQPLQYKPSWNVSTKSITTSDRAAVEALAREAVRDYVEEDLDALQSTLDSQATPLSAPPHDVQLGFAKAFNDLRVVPSNVEPMLTFGNSKLAFVLVAASGEGPKDFGITHSAVILRNEGEGWRVLYLSPSNPLPSLESLLRSFDGLGLQDEIAETVPEISQLAPADNAKGPSKPGLEMEWAKVDPPPATYVFEFQSLLPWGRDLWGRSDLALISPVSNGPTMRKRWSNVPGRWRVWAITRGGTVGLSEWRTVTVTY